MCKLVFDFHHLAVLAILFLLSVSFGEQNMRIITDLRTIYEKRGVDLDYRYNETHSNSNGLSSVPGCPKSISGLPWIYFGNPKTCYLAHFTGPCCKGEVLITQYGSPYGICGCECLSLNPDKYNNLRANKGDRYLGCKDEENEISKNFPFGQVFDTMEQKCYEMYSKGPCEKTGEVITDFTGENITCQPLCNKTTPNWIALHRKRLCVIVSQ